MISRQKWVPHQDNGATRQVVRRDRRQDRGKGGFRSPGARVCTWDLPRPAQGRCSWGGMKIHLQLCPASPRPGATAEGRATESIGLAACLSSEPCYGQHLSCGKDLEHLLHVPCWGILGRYSPLQEGEREPRVWHSLGCAGQREGAGFCFQGQLVRAPL